MKRIIIADDSGTARMFVRRCLEIAGFAGAEFIEVEDGRGVLDSLKKSPIDMIVTDLTMYPVDGTELLTRLREAPEWAAIPVIVITSANNAAKEAELLSLGARAVLGKPVSPAGMAAVLKTLDLK